MIGREQVIEIARSTVRHRRARYPSQESARAIEASVVDEVAQMEIPKRNKDLIKVLEHIIRRAETPHLYSSGKAQ